MSERLPIDEHLTEICLRVLKSKTFVLKASPGSGKTTRVPLAFLSHFNQKVLVLEPRRLAAKFAATRVAYESSTKLGQKIGYAFRFDRVVSEETRLIFYTEGTFLRHLLSNPDLTGIDVVVLDEFHERHRETDVAWALLQKIQKEKRPDLRLVVMSATLDKKILPNEATYYEVEAPLFPMEIHYLPHTSEALNLPLEKKVYDALWEALDQEGDILVFLPGMKDILRTKERLLPLCEENEIDLFILHGDLSNEEQAQVMRKEGNRKVILSTNIAESSLTIPGVRIVIDSGLFRESSFSPWSGLTHLETKKISKASAIQRAGRAARIGAGHVYRLYSKHEFQERSEFEKAEILRTDLCETLLLLSHFSVEDSKTLLWPEIPSDKSLEASKTLLEKLGAIQNNKLTELGREMGRFPIHPRLARLMVEALNSGEEQLKKMIHFISSLEEDEFLAKRLGQQLLSLTKGKAQRRIDCLRPLEALILKGFVDRIGQIRENKQFQILLCNGETLNIKRELQSELSLEHPLVVVLNVSSFGEVTRLVGIEEEWLYELEPFPVEEKRVVAWEASRKVLTLSEELRLGQILLSQNKKTLQDQNISQDLKEQACKIMKGVLVDILEKNKMNETYKRLFHLAKLVGRKIEEFNFEDWIQARAERIFSLKDEEEQVLIQDFFYSLEDFLDPEKRYPLFDFFPEKITLSDRRTTIIHYDEEPWVEGFIQDFYGMKITPTIAKGRVPLVLRLLGPHKRPLQITRDLVSFWNKTYKELHNELSREYPRHHWPLQPESALPVLLKRQLPS